MDLKVRTENYYTDDHSWLGSADGVTGGDTIELNLALFTEATHFPNGYIPSGTVLAEVGQAGGVYGAYSSGGVNEVQRLTRTSTGGTITLAYEGEVSETIVASAAGFTKAAVQAGLESIVGLESGMFKVTGSAGGPIDIEFIGELANRNVEALVVDNTSATGGTIVQSTVTAGVAQAVTDGLDVAAYHLLFGVDVSGSTDGTGRFIATGFRRGKVKTANLPTNHGLDEAAKAAMSLIDYV